MNEQSRLRMSASFLIGRRSFLATGGLTIVTMGLPWLLGRKAFGASASPHHYKLAPESILPTDIRSAPENVREAYRFALANREALRYIPCYCGCGADGHTSNASCYFKDSSFPARPVFDRMSLN